MKYIFLLSLLIIISCSFKPIYNSNEVEENKLRLELDPKTDKLLNNKFRSYLYEEFNSSFDDYESCYLLKVSINYEIASALKSDTGYSTRNNVVLTTLYSVIDECDKIELGSGKIKTVDSVYVAESRFTNYNANQFAIENLMKLAVKELNMRLKQISFE